MPAYSMATLGVQLPEPHRHWGKPAGSAPGMLCANPSQDLNQTLTTAITATTTTTSGAITCSRLHIYPQKISEPPQPTAVP